MTDAQIEIENYTPLRADRPKRKGGGCLLYTHKSLLISQEFSISDNYNSLLICVLDNINTIVVVVYRPPDSPTESFQKILRTAQEKIDSINNDRRDADIFLLGDLNLPGINWEFLTIDTNQSREAQQSCTTLLDFMDTNFLTQLIKLPTRKENILDLVFTNRPEYVIETKSTPTSLSDHNIVEILLRYNPISPAAKTTIDVDPLSFRAVDFHKADFTGLNKDLEDVDWPMLKELCQNDADGSMFLELIRLVVLQLTLKHSPPKTEKSGSYKGKTVRQEYTMKRKRRKLKAKAAVLQIKNPTSQLLPKLKNDVNLLTYDIKEHIMANLDRKETKAVETIKSNPRYFFSYAKRFAKTKSTISPLRDEDGTLKMTAYEKAEILQSQYVKVFSDPESADIDNCISTLKENLPELGDVPAISDLFFTESHIVKAIKELDPYSSTSDGDIPARILCSCKENLAVPLTLLWADS